MSWTYDSPAIYDYNAQHTISVFGSEYDLPEVDLNVTWDTAATAVSVANVTMKGIRTTLGVGFSLVLYVNDNQVIRIDWGAFDSSEKSATADILVMLVNGTNKFRVHVIDPGGAIPFSNAYYKVGATMHLEGTGTKPGVTPPTEDVFGQIWAFIKPWVPVISIGGALLFVAWLAAPELQAGIRGLRGTFGGESSTPSPPPAYYAPYTPPPYYYAPPPPAPYYPPR